MRPPTSFFLAAAMLVTPFEGSAEPLPGDARASVAESLTVEQCVSLAGCHAPAVVAAGLDRAAAGLDSIATAANGRPDIALRAGANVAPRGFYDLALTNLGDYEARIGLDWTVADGGRRSRARERGGLGVATARARSSLDSLTTRVQTAELALELFHAQRLEAIHREAHDWLARLGVLVRAGVASGARSASDSIRVALERDEVAAELEAVTTDRRTGTIELRILLGIELPEPVTIVASGATQERPMTEADSDRLLQAVERHPEVALARLEESVARLDLLDAARAASPELGFSLDAGLAGTNLTAAVPGDLLQEDPHATFGTRIRRDLGASGGIHLRVPLFSASVGPSRRAREAVLEASKVRTKFAAESQRGRAMILIARWRSASRRVDAANATAVRAEGNLLRMKSLYAAGATTLLDLLDARRVYDRARVAVADASWDETVARSQAEAWR